MALLAQSPVQIERPLLSEDPVAFVIALRDLGLQVSGTERMLSIGTGTLADGGTLYCGASGSMLRFLLAALTTIPGSWLVDGTPRLRERPVGDLVDALRRLGARIECVSNEGFAPLRITGGRLDGGSVEVDASTSSQFVSGLMMASTRAAEPVEIQAQRLVSAPYVEITRRVIQEWGGSVQLRDDGRFVVSPSSLEGGRVAVEADFSSACYPAAGTALVGGTVRLPGLNAHSAQGDRGFFDLLRDMGATVEWQDDVAVVRGNGRLTAVDRDMSGMPDQVPTLAALAPFAEGVTRIRAVPHLRIKESDRLATVAAGLRAAGAAVEEYEDGLLIPGIWAESEPPATSVTIDTADDHRIAMSFAVLGLGRSGVEIAYPEVVDKSYPRFWSDFSRCFEAE
jgi:3-phosphoshikimate 1-carboxyvinyltransferase